MQAFTNDLFSGVKCPLSPTRRADLDLLRSLYNTMSVQDRQVLSACPQTISGGSKSTSVIEGTGVRADDFSDPIVTAVNNCRTVSTKPTGMVAICEYYSASPYSCQKPRLDKLKFPVLPCPTPTPEPCSCEGQYDECPDGKNVVMQCAASNPQVLGPRMVSPPQIVAKGSDLGRACLNACESTVARDGGSGSMPASGMTGLGCTLPAVGKPRAAGAPGIAPGRLDLCPATPTPTVTPSQSATPSTTPTSSSTPSGSPNPTNSSTPQATMTATTVASAAPTATATATSTTPPSATHTPASPATSTATPASTATPTTVPPALPSATPTRTPTSAGQVTPQGDPCAELGTTENTDFINYINSRYQPPYTYRGGCPILNPVATRVPGEIYRVFTPVQNCANDIPGSKVVYYWPDGELCIPDDPLLRTAQAVLCVCP